VTDSEVHAIFDKEIRRECEWTRMRRDLLPHLVRYTLTDVGQGGGFIS
jgi:lysozyme family protein